MAGAGVLGPNGLGRNSSSPELDALAFYFLRPRQSRSSSPPCFFSHVRWRPDLAGRLALRQTAVQGGSSGRVYGLVDSLAAAPAGVGKSDNCTSMVASGSSSCASSRGAASFGAANQSLRLGTNSWKLGTAANL